MNKVNSRAVAFFSVLAVAGCGAQPGAQPGAQNGPRMDIFDEPDGSKMVGFVRIDAGANPEGAPINVPDIETGMGELLLAGKPSVKIGIDRWRRTDHNQWVVTGYLSVNEVAPVSFPNANLKGLRSFEARFVEDSGRLGQAEWTKFVNVGTLPDGSLAMVDIKDGAVTMVRISLPSVSTKTASAAPAF